MDMDMDQKPSEFEPIQFNDLPDELVEQIIDYRQPGFDQRSRTLAQDKCRELLNIYKHNSLNTERIISNLECLPTPHLQYYTFIQELKKYLSPQQLQEISLCETLTSESFLDRIHQMALIAQTNQDYATALVARKCDCQRWDDDAVTANHFRTQLQRYSINFEAINYLYLSNSMISSFPEEIIQLRGLEYLNLSGNLLTSVSDNLGLLIKLKLLNLSENQLRSIPDSLGQLSNLRHLNLSLNQLRSIPDCLGQLSSLEELDLSRNHLVTIPNSLRRLPRLGRLYICYNHLTLESLRSLGYLDEYDPCWVNTVWLRNPLMFVIVRPQTIVHCSS